MKSFNEYIIKKSEIKNNLKKFKKFNKSVKICAVIKANGYGIGDKDVVKQIDCDVDFYAVACFVEAERLRKLSNRPILILNFVPKTSILDCIEKNISISISSFQQVKLLINYLKNKKPCQKIKIHFAINTGMNRIGFDSINQFYKTLVYLKKYKSLIDIEGIFTHFYNASIEVDNKKQISIFIQFSNLLSQFFDIDKIIKHTCGSVGAITCKKFHFDMVRLGIMLYSEINERCKKVLKYNFKDTITIKSKVINITKVKKGECVGYGKTILKKELTIATIPLGYADGIFRSFSPKGKVIVGGKFCKVIGNVCMDMFMIDVSNTNVKIGDEVILIGKDKFGHKITLNDFAKWSGTISYEVLTNIKKDRFDVKIQ